MNKRVKLEVSVDLDPIPGAFHTEEDARKWIQMALDRAIEDYKPEVKIISTD